MIKILAFSIYFGILLDGGACQNEEIEFLHWLPNKLPNVTGSNRNLSAECRRDLDEWSRGIENAETWAISMVDSMEKNPIGLKTGRSTFFGNFDECLEVVHPNFRGQHCLVELSLKQASQKPKLSEIPSLPERLMGNRLTYGVCLPSTCTSADLKNALGSLGLNEIFWTEVYERGCVAGSPALRTGDYYVLAFLAVLVLLAIASTFYEMLLEDDEKTEMKSKILTSFSLQSNIKYLLHISESSSALNFLHGVRFFSYGWVVLGHLGFFGFLYGNQINMRFKVMVTKSTVMVPLTNAYLSVDTFFFLSGILVCFVFFRMISEKGYYDAPMVLVHRYFRMTPALAVVILFSSSILTRTINAPYSKLVLDEVEESCRNYWWSYLFYVQNYFEDMRHCLPQGWYLGADMQMFLISPIILYGIYHWPKFAFKYLCVLILGSTFLSFLVCYVDDAGPSRFLDFFEVRSKPSEEYVWFFTRISSWLVGVATGYVICGIRAEKISFRLGKVWVVVGWLVALAVCSASVFGIVRFLPKDLGLASSTLEKSSYRAFHRLGWCLGLSWITIACVTDNGGIVNKILSLNIFQPLGKLSYSAFLLHVQLQLYRHLNDNKSLKYGTIFDGMYAYFGDVTISLLLSIPLYLLVELPCTNCEKILFQNVKIFQYPRQLKHKDATTNKV